MPTDTTFNDRTVATQIKHAFKRRYYTLGHKQTLITMLFEMGRDRSVAFIESTVAEISRQAGVCKTVVKEAIDFAVAAGHLIKRRTFVDGWFRGQRRRGYGANHYEFQAVDTAKMAELNRDWRREIRPGKEGLEESVFLTVSLLPPAREEEGADEGDGSEVRSTTPGSGDAPGTIGDLEHQVRRTACSGTKVEDGRGNQIIGHHAFFHSRSGVERMASHVPSGTDFHVDQKQTHSSDQPEAMAPVLDNSGYHRPIGISEAKQALRSAAEYISRRLNARWAQRPSQRGAVGASPIRG